MNIRHLIGGGLVATALVVPAAVQAQMSNDEVKERGAELVAMWWDADADALWSAMTEGFQTQVGNIDALIQSRDDVVDQFGEEAEVLEVMVLPAGDNMAYWRIVELEQGPEPFIIHLVLQADGMMALGRAGFESQIGSPPAARVTPRTCIPPYSGTSFARGGMPGSMSMIPTVAGRLNRSGPALPGFITVTTTSTVSSKGLWEWPYTRISAAGNRAWRCSGVGDPNWSP